MTRHPRFSRDVILRTRRWTEALRFYETTLGFSVIHRSDWLVGLDAGAFVLYVENGDDHGPVFDLLTPDVAATKDRLLAAGCSLVEEDARVPKCYLADPFGLVFNLGTRASGVA